MKFQLRIIQKRRFIKGRYIVAAITIYTFIKLMSNVKFSKTKVVIVVNDDYAMVKYKSVIKTLQVTATINKGNLLKIN